MPSANVISTEALAAFRAALATFTEEAGGCLVNVDMELRRGLHWLLEEQPMFWVAEQRRLSDLVMEARAELHRCKSTALPGEVAPCSEQKHALERAIQRLRHAEDKGKATKRWGHLVEHEAREYQGRASQYHEVVERELPAAMAMLERTLRSLESYTAASIGGGSVSGSSASSSSATTDSPSSASPESPNASH